MMFLAELAFAVELLALTAGVSLFIWSLRNSGAGQSLAKFVGLIVSVSAVLGLICTSFYSLLYWFQGSFSTLS